MPFPFAYFFSGDFLGLKRLASCELEQLGLVHWIGFASPFVSNLSVDGVSGFALHLEKNFDILDFEWTDLKSDMKENQVLLGVHKQSVVTPKILAKPSFQYGFHKVIIGSNLWDIPLIEVDFEKGFANCFEHLKDIGSRCIQYFKHDQPYDETQMLVDAQLLLNVNYAVSLNEVLASKIFDHTQPKLLCLSVISILRASIYFGKESSTSEACNG